MSSWLDIQGDIEQNMEDIDGQVEQLNQEKQQLEDKVSKIESAMNQVSEDAQINELVGRNLEQKQEAIAQVDQEKQAYAMEVFDLQSQLEAAMEDVNHSQDVIGELRAIGEDVTEAEAVLEDRMMVVEQCQTKLQEIADKLGISLDEILSERNGEAGPEHKSGESEQEQAEASQEDLDGDYAARQEANRQINAQILQSQYANRTRDLNKADYEAAGEVAQNIPGLRAFTDHKQAHVEMVAEKSLEMADALEALLGNPALKQRIGDGEIAFAGNMDKAVLAVAALSHDTGMKGGGYALIPLRVNGKLVYEKNSDGSYKIKKESDSDADEIRNNHSLNSAINVLARRNEFRNMGFSDEQIDQIAIECMAHTKSRSGVSNLNSKADWADCFDRIQAAVDAYNQDHKDGISFDRKPFEADDRKLGQLASETLALRVGDVSRDSRPNAEAQSGENVFVDRATLDDRGGTMDNEIANAFISIGEKREAVTNVKSRRIHAGEQNIVGNRTYVGASGKIVHEITVAQGASAPQCTIHAIKDHLSEFATANALDFEVKIRFEKFDGRARSKADRAYKALARENTGQIRVIVAED